MADEKKPTLPNGIGESEFNSWKHHPVTRAYLKFLADKREDTRMAALDGWEGGKLNNALSDEMRGVANTLKLASEPDFGEIVQFYDEINQMKKEEMQANEPTDGKQIAEG
mgnify:CR=1 FL=1